MVKQNDEKSGSQATSKRRVADADQRIVGPGGLLVAFLNTTSECLDEPARRLQAVAREVIDYMLEERPLDRSTGERERGAPPQQFLEWMTRFSDWYDEHPYAFAFNNWEHVQDTPLAAMFRPVDGISRYEHAAALAAFDLWLTLLLADREAYRSGAGLVFVSIPGDRLRLLRCRVCGRYQQRWYGRGASIDATCAECRAQRSGGSCAREYQNKKLTLRVRWLVEVWGMEPWSCVGKITPAAAGRVI